MRILYLEPFDDGSHREFTRAVTRHVAADWTVVTMPGRHWKWRMRGSALWMTERHREELEKPHDLVFCSSFLPLADLVGLAPQLAALPKVVWFHENQWAYPVRDERERDHHFGFTQLTSAACANLCLFNSEFNRETFVEGCREAIARMPDARPLEAIDRIEERAEVFGLPLELGDVSPEALGDLESQRESGPLILWNHRWEHDKAPEEFFGALLELKARRVPFRVAVCGRRYAKCPEIFETARKELGSRVESFGELDTREAYVEQLLATQIVISTAQHEFFGAAMIEATHYGAHPLVPDRLAYPELFPARYRYRTRSELVDTLQSLCMLWSAGERDLRSDRREITARFGADTLGPKLGARLAELVDQSP